MTIYLIPLFIAGATSRSHSTCPLVGELKDLCVHLRYEIDVNLINLAVNCNFIKLSRSSSFRATISSKRISFNVCFTPTLLVLSPEPYRFTNDDSFKCLVQVLIGSPPRY